MKKSHIITRLTSIPSILIHDGKIQFSNTLSLFLLSDVFVLNSEICVSSRNVSASLSPLFGEARYPCKGTSLEMFYDHKSPVGVIIYCSRWIFTWISEFEHFFFSGEDVWFEQFFFFTSLQAHYQNKYIIIYYYFIL